MRALLALWGLLGAISVVTPATFDGATLGFVVVSLVLCYLLVMGHPKPAPATERSDQE